MCTADSWQPGMDSCGVQVLYQAAPWQCAELSRLLCPGITALHHVVRTLAQRETVSVLTL